MARRPAGGDDDISLFPFLSIIACVIGVLTLMIATVTMAQMDTEDIALIEAYENTVAAISEHHERLLALKKRLDEQIGPAAVLARQQAEANQKELERLLQQIETVHAELEKQKAVKIVMPKLDPAQQESIGSMQTELKSLEEEIAQMEKDLSGRKETPAANVSVLPSGSGLAFTPHFIECADGAMVLHDLNPPKTIRAGDMVNDEDFRKILETVANSVHDSIVFLIRSDGLNTYQAARKICTDRDIRNGKLPVVGKGKIDLSYFNKKSGEAQP